MLINLRNALMTGKRLPYDAEVEFLESTGTQYVDTGIGGDSNTIAELTFAMTDSSRSDAGIFGARKAYRDDCFCILRVQASGGAFWMHYGDEGTSANYISTVIGNTTDWHVARLAKSWSIDNSSGTAGNYTFTTPTTLKLFAADMSASSRWYAKCRVSLLRIYSNGVLVRDYIPVRKGTVGYLYDRVSGKLFGNAGTGDFVLGSDVVPVEYIESHGTEYINTGIILNDTYGIDINFAPMETASGVSEHGIFGSSVSGSGIRHNVLQIHSSAGGLGLWMPSNTRICNYAITIGEYQHWQINLNDSDEVVIDNVLKAHTHPTTPAECQYPVYLFGRNVANTLKSGSCSKMRLAMWIVCDGSGNFIQKGLPVRVGTDATSWEGAMMDVLTRRIYRNAGSGAFTYGNDLKYPIPSE